ncbi:kinase-like protein [Rhizodiscina lignyota]|uniref:Kinase-like protein n=1 Tax=Rhizodiscina lignyota TaxID=1504668 RepID=A0A9P4IT32_9PEZI|nr:kinase-like protein [Rhizodiscina lignyota]
MGDQLEQRAHKPAPRSNEVRNILLRTPDNGLSNDSDFLDQEKVLSLTSATTTPSVDEARTPLEPVNEYFMSPVGATHPIDFTTSPQENAIESWPNRSASQRTRSYRTERSTGSLRKASRRPSRQSSMTSVSPASAFLSQWGRTHATEDSGPPAPQEPDAEGMEIGDHSQYIIGKEVGRGGFSVVKEVHTFEDNVKVIRAVKIVRKNIDGKSELENEKLQSDFEREVEIWRYLKHPYILPLLAVYDTPFATFCITQLNVGGTLFDLVRANRRQSDARPKAGLPLHLAKRYIYQLASALRYLHEDLHVVHRDVKLENCLLDMSRPDAATEGGNILLCDFGMADWASKEGRSSPDPLDHADSAMSNSVMSTTLAGSLNYAAPEMINEGGQLYSTAVDVWAFGVVSYALLTGELPFSHSFEPRVVMAISKGEYNIDLLRDAPAVQEASQDIVEMVMGCLEMDAGLRLTISDVLESKWLEGCRELFEEVNCPWT